MFSLFVVGGNPCRKTFLYQVKTNKNHKEELNYGKQLYLLFLYL